MAVNSTILIAAKYVRSLDTGAYNIGIKPTLPAAANADNIQLFTMPHDARMLSAHLRVPNTLGASATLKLQRNRGGSRVDITSATTAATAGVVTSSGLAPLDLLAGDIIEALVGGGALTAGQVEVDVLAQHS